MATRLSAAERKRHRELAVDAFNGTWKLLRKRKRTRIEDLAMIHMAHASRHHWGLVGTPKEWAIGEWQVSHVYAALRRPEPARYHAAACLDLCRRHSVGDFPLAYAYEALARASALAGRKPEAARYLRLGLKAAQGIREADDRALFLSDLKTVPGYRSRGRA